MKFTYTGPIVTSFSAPGHGYGTGDIAPGDTFAVPASFGPSFAQHGHLEPADDEAHALLAEIASKAEAARAAAEDADTDSTGDAEPETPTDAEKAPSDTLDGTEPEAAGPSSGTDAPEQETAPPDTDAGAAPQEPSPAITKRGRSKAADTTN